MDDQFGLAMWLQELIAQTLATARALAQAAMSRIDRGVDDLAGLDDFGQSPSRASGTLTTPTFDPVVLKGIVGALGGASRGQSV